MGRSLKFNIFRFNPEDPASVPRMEAYALEETEAMTLYIALNRLREEQDPTLMFDFMCRAGICGACAMMINGRPDLACHTKTKNLPEEITLMPMPVFKLVGDLSVDTGTWFRGMNEKVQSWVHTTRTFNPGEEEQRMSNALSEEIYELERCIECGCCVAACGKANMVPDNFMGATAFNRIVRFMIDPRDERNNDEYFEVVGNEDGIFGCLGLLGCEDTCPKKIPLQDQLGMLRRKMGFSQVKHLFRALLPGKKTA